MKKKPKITKTVIEEVADNNDLINGIFSKRLAIANTVLYFGVVAYCLGIYTATGKLPVEVLESTGTIYGVVISGYFVKAGAENYTKIRESDYYGNPRNQKYPDQNETEVNGSI